MASVQSPPFIFLSVPNRSLGPSGRRWALGAIAATTLGVAGFAMAIGAWPVMPFAGLEVGLVALAFRVLRLHDADFERLEVRDDEVVVEARCARSVSRFVANRPWTRVVLRSRGSRCTLNLAYAGRSVRLGRMLSDEGRRRLAAQLRARLAVTGK
jgi:uncharacterized membrane protein